MPAAPELMAWEFGSKPLWSGIRKKPLPAVRGYRNEFDALPKSTLRGTLGQRQAVIEKAAKQFLLSDSQTFYSPSGNCLFHRQHPVTGKTMHCSTLKPCWANLVVGLRKSAFRNWRVKEKGVEIWIDVSFLRTNIQFLCNYSRIFEDFPAMPLEIICRRQVLGFPRLIL